MSEEARKTQVVDVQSSVCSSNVNHVLKMMDTSCNASRFVGTIEYVISSVFRNRVMCRVLRCVICRFLRKMDVIDNFCKPCPVLDSRTDRQRQD